MPLDWDGEQTKGAQRTRALDSQPLDRGGGWQVKNWMLATAIGSLGALVLTASLCAAGGEKEKHGEHGRGEQEEMSQYQALAKAAKISLSAALEAAAKQVPGTAIKAELENEDGQAVYGIEILPSAGGGVKEVKIDAATGTLIAIEDEGAEGEETGGHGGEWKKGEGRKEWKNEKHCEKREKGEGSACPWTEAFAPEPGGFSSTGSNPFFILQPGYQLVLEGKEGDTPTRVTITVLDQTKVIDNVETRVVEERETKNGELAEVSRNYYAIGRQTNSVFYFGEDVDIYKQGTVAGHEGSWQSGVEEAKFGLMMPGIILSGSRYYQERAPGVAMDRAEVVSIGESFKSPAGEFRNCLKTEETAPEEPGDRDYKLYAPGVGLIQDGELQLVRYGPVQK